MKTLDEIIAEAQKFWPQGLIVDLERIRDSGVFVERGTRAWACAVTEAGLGVKCPTSNRLESIQEVAVFGWKTGWELAPPAEREVTPWEACQAWWEGKEVKYSDEYGWHRKGDRHVFNFDGSGKYYVREPEGGK